MTDDPGVRPDAGRVLDAMPDGLGHWLLNRAGTVAPDGVVAIVTGDDTDGYLIESKDDRLAPGPYSSLEDATAAAEAVFIDGPGAA